MRFFLKLFIVISLFLTAEKSFSQTLLAKNVNGMNILVLEDFASPIVSIQLWVSTGSVNERDEEAGFAHFLEHLTFRSKDIAKRIEDLGGDINAYTTLDRTVYHLTIPKDHYEEGLNVLSDIFYSTDFTEESFRTEKEVILEEMKRGYDDPQRELYKFFFEKTLKNHPARRPVIGFEETIKNAQKDAITNFYKNYYTSKNSFIVIVGNVKQDNAVRAVKKFFKDKKDSNFSTKHSEREPDINTGIYIKKKKIQSCYLMSGFPTPDIYSEEAPAIDVLSYIYGESSTSILNEDLKEKKSLVNYIYSYQLATKDLGFFIIQANFPCKNIELVADELSKKLFLEDLKINNNNLKKVLKNYETNYLFSREKYEDIAKDLGYSFFYFNDPDYSKKYIGLIKKVSLDDINRAKNRYLKPERYSFTLLIPEELSENDVSEKIKKIFEKNVSEKSVSQETFQLRNGIKLSVYKKSSTNVFSINIASLAGSRLEEREEAGLSYFVASTVLRGTKNRSYKDILEEIEAMGGTLNGYSSKNITGINGRFLREDFEKSIILISDILSNFNPSKEEIEKVKKLILEEIRRKKERPTNVLRDLYFSEVFKDTIFSYPTEGIEDTVVKFNENNVKKLFFNIFSSDKIHISLAGDLPDNYLEILNKYFGNINETRSAIAKTVYPSKTIRNITEKSNFNQSHILVGFVIPGIRSPLRAEFHLLSQILSNQSGRLFTNLRDKKGLAYSVGSFIFEFPEASLFNLYIATSPQKVEIAKKGLLDELKDLFLTGITDEELNKAKNQIIFNYAELMQKSSDISSTLVQNHLYFDNPFHFNNFLKDIKNVNLTNFTKNIKDFFKEDKAFFIVLTNDNLK